MISFKECQILSSRIEYSIGNAQQREKEDILNGFRKRRGNAVVIAR